MGKRRRGLGEHISKEERRMLKRRPPSHSNKYKGKVGQKEIARAARQGIESGGNSNGSEANGGQNVILGYDEIPTNTRALNRNEVQKKGYGFWSALGFEFANFEDELWEGFTFDEVREIAPQISDKVGELEVRGHMMVRQGDGSYYVQLERRTVSLSRVLEGTWGETREDPYTPGIIYGKTSDIDRIIDFSPLRRTA